MKTNFFLIVFVVFSVTALLTACSGSKKTLKGKSAQPEEVLLDVPFSDFLTNSKAFRAVGIAQSPDMNMAKKVAIQNAKSEIAGTIRELFQEVSTQYKNQRNLNGNIDFEQKDQSMNQSIVSEILSDVNIKDIKYFKVSRTNDYKCYVALEMLREDLRKTVGERLSKEAKDRIDFDEMEYRELFDKVLGNFKK